MRLQVHRVFITGGTRGIGLELARALRARGAEVAVCCGSEAYPHVRVVEVVPPLVDTGMTAGRGAGKIAPAEAAAAIVAGLEGDATEIYIGKAKLLRAIHRLAPGLAARIMRPT